VEGQYIPPAAIIKTGPATTLEEVVQPSSQYSTKSTGEGFL
jgi:hypothetical protein